MVEPNIDPNAPPAGDPPPEENGAFYSSLSEEHQANATMQNFKTADGDTIAKTLIEQQSAMGKKGLPLPDFENPDSVRKFYIDAGAPGDPTKYDISPVEDAEAINYSPDVYKEFADTLGLNNHQAEAGQKFFTDNQRALIAQQKKAEETARGEASQIVRKSMGPEYEENVKRTEALADTFSRTPEEAEKFKEMMKDNPYFRFAMSDVVGVMSENNLKGFAPKSYGISKEDAQARITEISNSPEYRSNDINVRQPLMDEINKLDRIISGV